MKSKQTMSTLLSVFVSFASWPTPAVAQITYRESPDLQWDVRVQSVQQGNGVFLTADNEMLVSTSNIGSVSGFGAKDGSEIFQFDYVPATTTTTSDNEIEFISSNSGIAFGRDFMVYSILVNENSLQPLTRVISLSMSGEQLWVSPSLEGTSPGTPVISGDDMYIFLTHNSNEATVGHFTILNAKTGSIFFTQRNNVAPFAPLGIFINPAEGYYDGGENNQNDLILWSVQPKPTDTAVGPGATFAFQFPIGFISDDVVSVSNNPTTTTTSSISLSYTQLGNQVKDFQTIQKPLIVDEGRTMYWGTSRSQYRCWIGQEGLDRFRFSRARTFTIGFSRGTPPMQAIYATPALSNDPMNRFVFGGTAAAEFVKISADFADEVLVPTQQIVKSTAHVSPDDQYVYYAESDGFLHQASTTDLADRWSIYVGGMTEGEFALSKDGTHLFIGDSSGFIRAYRVGDGPTDAPSLAPSSTPTMVISSNPTTAMTNTPTLLPSVAPTNSPVATTIFLERTIEPTLNDVEGQNEDQISVSAADTMPIHNMLFSGVVIFSASLSIIWIM